MQDFEMTLDKNEAANIQYLLGEVVPKTSVLVFIWAENENVLTISVSVEGEEKHVIEISDRGKKISIKKD